MKGGKWGSVAGKGEGGEEDEEELEKDEFVTGG